MIEKILDAIIPLTGVIWTFGKWKQEKQIYMLLCCSLLAVLFLYRWPCELVMPLPLVGCSFVSAGFMIYETRKIKKKLKKKGFLTGYLYAIVAITMGLALLAMCFV